MSQPTPLYPVEVERPPLQPYRYGLLAAATVLNEPASARWSLSGVAYPALPCPPAGGPWGDPCRDPAPPVPPTTAFTVTLSKAAGVDTLTATLSARHADYGTTPVFVSVDGTAQPLATVGATATWPVTASSTVAVIASIAPGTTLPRCDTSAQFPVPATGETASQPVSCQVSPTTEVTKNLGDGLIQVTGRAFTVYGSASCFTPSGVTDEELLQLARRALAAREQQDIENRWYGEELAVFGTEVLNDPLGTPVPLSWAVGMLEQAIASRLGGLGVIHAPHWLGAILQHTRLSPVTTLVPTTTEPLYTPMAHRYALGVGYSNVAPPTAPGAEPQRAPDGQVWLYATGPVTARLTEVQAFNTLNHSRNERNAVAERNAVLTADCPRVAVLASLPE